MSHLRSNYFLLLTGFVALSACSGPSNFNLDDVKQGYVFKVKKAVQEIGPGEGFSIDTVERTITDFEIVDTIEAYDRYVLKRKIEGGDLDLKGVNDINHIGLNGIEFIGLANFNEEFVIYPRINYWDYLGNGYAIVRFHGKREFGIVHIRGEMTTDLKYHSIEPSADGNVFIGSFKEGSHKVQDTFELD